MLKGRKNNNDKKSGRWTSAAVGLWTVLPLILTVAGLVLWLCLPGNRYEEREVMRLKITGQTVLDTAEQAMPLPLLPMDSICNAIETDSPVLYARQKNGMLKKAESINAFWFTRGRRIATKPGEAVCRLLMKEDRLEFVQARLQVLEGDTYGAECYLMNEKTGSYVTLDTYISILSEAPPTLYELMHRELRAKVPAQSETTPSATLKVPDMSSICRAIRTQKPTLYAVSYHGHISKNYTLEPLPGFWLTERGRITNTHSRVSRKKASVGVCFADGCLIISVFPDARLAGRTVSFDLFFVNEETGDYASLTTSLDFV